ncbi:patatin-like phospholipase family protein [Comamonadaceae bacterium G21597-S1]|nr:patatin-like phospholipase family protein [Comamonadaceae bacterium G21597-S1]
MSLDTIIHAGLRQYDRPTVGLVLMGGGARTAYQVGVLRALAGMLQARADAPRGFPFQVLVGTSAGAINAAFLASRAMQGLQAFEQLAQFWRRLRSSDVFDLNVPTWVRFSRIAVALSLSRHAQANGAMMDNAPLRETLRKGILLDGIGDALRSNTIDALAVTGSSYTSGVHWTFCHTASRGEFHGWSRPGRRAEYQPLTIDHLMASSAIPFLFPATALQVDGRNEFFGDGSMRQVTPLSPAMHLGARRILVVGVGQPERSGLGGTGSKAQARGPTLGSMAGHVMASVFHDTLQADVEQTARVTQTINRLPAAAASALPFKAVDVLAVAPTQSLDALAQKFTSELPAAIRHAMGALGVLKGSGGTLASYLLFEPRFVQSLMALGEHDALALKDELLELVLGA